MILELWMVSVHKTWLLFPGSLTFFKTIGSSGGQTPAYGQSPTQRRSLLKGPGENRGAEKTMELPTFCRGVMLWPSTGMLCNLSLIGNVWHVKQTYHSRDVIRFSGFDAEKPTINLLFGDGLDNPFMVLTGGWCMAWAGPHIAHVTDMASASTHRRIDRGPRKHRMTRPSEVAMHVIFGAKPIAGWVAQKNLVGGLEQFFFPYIGNNHPNWRTHIFQRGGPGPPTRNARGKKPMGLARLWATWLGWLGGYPWLCNDHDVAVSIVMLLPQSLAGWLMENAIYKWMMTGRQPYLRKPPCIMNYHDVPLSLYQPGPSEPFLASWKRSLALRSLGKPPALNVNIICVCEWATVLCPQMCLVMHFWWIRHPKVMEQLWDLGVSYYEGRTTCCARRGLWIFAHLVANSQGLGWLHLPWFWEPFWERQNTCRKSFCLERNDWPDWPWLKIDRTRLNWCIQIYQSFVSTLKRC